MAASVHIDVSGQPKGLGRRIAIVAVVVVLLAALFWYAWGVISADLRQSGAVTVRQAILDGAMQCCAIEGSYPQTLEYLEEHYGLVVNDRDVVPFCSAKYN